MKYYKPEIGFYYKINNVFNNLRRLIRFLIDSNYFHN